MRAQLAGLAARDVDGDLRLWRPADPERFGIEVHVALEAGGEAHGFDAGICSPRWFAERFATVTARRPETRGLRGLELFRALADGGRPFDVERAPAPPEHARLTGLVFAHEWDHRRLAATIRGLCERVDEGDGPSLAEHVARLLAWEYDFRHDRAARWTPAHVRPRLAA